MCLQVSYKKKTWINFFFGILKVLEERSRIRSWIRIRIFRGTDPRFRTKMSWIPNTAFKFGNLSKLATRFTVILFLDRICGYELEPKTIRKITLRWVCERELQPGVRGCGGGDAAGGPPARLQGPPGGRPPRHWGHPGRSLQFGNCLPRVSLDFLRFDFGVMIALIWISQRNMSLYKASPI